MKLWFQSKTIWANIGIILGVVGGYILNGIDPKTAIIMTIVALANGGLRFVTTTGIGTPADTPK